MGLERLVAAAKRKRAIAAAAVEIETKVGLAAASAPVAVPPDKEVRRDRSREVLVRDASELDLDAVRIGPISYTGGDIWVVRAPSVITPDMHGLPVMIAADVERFGRLPEAAKPAVIKALIEFPGARVQG